MNNYKQLGYTGAGLGLMFLTIAVVVLYLATKQITELPYFIASFIIGIIFVFVGISGFWLSYLKFEKSQKLKTTQNTEETPLKSTYRQDFQETNQKKTLEPAPAPSFTPEIKKESKIEKEVHIIERYYRYSIKCPYCETVYDDKLAQCPKCGGRNTAASS